MSVRRLLLCICLLATAASRAAAGETPEFPFTLSKPAGAGPFPAVVILHDCSGLGPKSSGAPWRWSAVLTERGYVTVWPDSFTPRGRPKGVCSGAAGPRITHDVRAGDAYAALEYLRSLPFVDPRRVAAIGGSHGGSSVLAAIVDTPANARRAPVGFAAAIALYPSCGRSFGSWSVTRTREAGTLRLAYEGAFKPRAPLLILIGELDDWTPAEPCRRLAAAAQAAGYPVEIKVYPSAHHSFDSRAPVRYVAQRINVNALTGRGATTGGNAEAWRDAIGRVERFLSEHLANRGRAD
jgi:dienelactone hydrolase